MIVKLNELGEKEFPYAYSFRVLNEIEDIYDNEIYYVVMPILKYKTVDVPDKILLPKKYTVQSTKCSKVV